MTERLRPEDLAFLRNESASTPMHNATLEVFEPAAGGFDDEDFDLTFHVRRSALPRPGSMGQLRELAARILDVVAEPRETGHDEWLPRREPNPPRFWPKRCTSRCSIRGWRRKPSS